MPNLYIFVPPHRVAEMTEEIRRQDQYCNTLRAFIERFYPAFGDPNWYQASKLVYDVLRLIDPVQPERLRVNAAWRILSRMGEIMEPWRWAILAPERAAQAALHQRLLKEEIEHREVAALFRLLHEQASILLEPPEDFYIALRKRVAGQVTTDMLGRGWSTRLKRHREVIMDPLALQEIGADIAVENLPAYDELFSVLPDRQRELMTLFYIHELSVREIADRCQLSLSGVTSQLTKARENLRQRLS